MKSNDFIKGLKKAVNSKTLYVRGCFGSPLNTVNKKRYTNNHSYNRRTSNTRLINNASDDTFGFDCVCLIKGILWGWRADTTKTYGGAIYISNGVPDFGADTMILRGCYDVSNDFTKIQPGEAVWLPGHIGIYIGNNEVIECTPKWDNGVQISNLVKGDKVRKWDKHGKLNYVEYDKIIEKEPEIIEEPNEVELINRTYKVKRGDTLTKIASEFNTTIDAIVKANKESHSKISRNFIVTGWNLIV